jgi:hypothetical protein
MPLMIGSQWFAKGSQWVLSAVQKGNLGSYTIRLLSVDQGSALHWIACCAQSSWRGTGFGGQGSERLRMKWLAVAIDCSHLTAAHQMDGWGILLYDSVNELLTLFLC